MLVERQIPPQPHIITGNIKSPAIVLMSQDAHSVKEGLPLKDLVKRKKSEYRYCAELSNGQLLNVFFWRNQAIIMGENLITWQVGIIISETRKQAKKWFLSAKNPYNSKSTGRCGLEGIKRATEIILDFRDSMKTNEMLFVGFEDSKRQSAYRRLKKYGFKEYEENGAVRYYASPNLIDRKWIEE